MEQNATSTSTVLLNGEQAKNELNELEIKAKSLRKSLKEAQEVGDLAGIKRYNNELKDTQRAMKTVRAEAFDAKKVLDNISGSSLKELYAAQKKIDSLLRNGTVPRNTAEWKELAEAQKKIKTEIKAVNAEMNVGESTGSKWANNFNKYFASITAGIAAITGLSFAFRALAEDVAHMDDVYSDVMKTTGMTREQVLALNEELKKIDTRTTRESLNNLARDAGKLGIQGTKDILGFVDAGNQINVALGEDLGEDAIKNIGKMVGVFQKSTKQLQGLGLKEQMLAVGSAVNELGASSTASEPFLVSFAGRLGGISKQAKISMADILGFASSLDQDMQAVEMSATALQQFIMKIMGDPAKFAKLAGLEVKGFTDLLNNDANAAIKQVLRSLSEKGGFQQLIPIFQEMGLDGARATGVLSTLAGSIDQIDEAQRIANQSMSEGVSITKEYDIKNNNLAARLDKAKKAFQETALELGQSLNPLLLKSTNATTYLVRSLVEVPKWLKENKISVIALVTVWGAYAVAVYGSIVADKLKVFWTDKVVVSLTRLWTTIKANPWALIATGAILAIGWLNNYLNKQREVNAEQKQFNDLAQKGVDIYANSKPLEERANIMKSLSKSQLETLKADLETQLSMQDGFDAEIKTKAQSALDNDAKYKALQMKASEAKTEFEKNAALTQLNWREDALLKELGAEFSKNNKSKKALEKHLQDVNALIKTKPNPTEFITPGALTKEEQAKQKEIEKDNLERSLKYVAKLDARYKEFQQNVVDTKKLMLDSIAQDIVDSDYELGKQLATHKQKKENELNYLEDLLVIHSDNLDESFKIESQARDLQMKSELAVAELTEEQIKAIKDKYRKLDEEAEGRLIQSKFQKLNEYAKASEGILNGLNDFVTSLGNRELADFKEKNEGKVGFEEEYAAKKTEIEEQGAKRAKALGVLATIISTSSAVMAALAPPPIGLGPVAGIPFSIAAAAKGALELAAILAAPTTGFADGGFTRPGGKHEPAGVVHAGEFVGSQESVGNSTLRKVFNLVDYAQRTNTVGRINEATIMHALSKQNGYADGGYVSRPTGTSQQAINIDMSAVIATMQQTNAVNAALLSEIQKGIKAKVSASGNDGVVSAVETYNKLIKNAKRS